MSFFKIANGNEDNNILKRATPFIIWANFWIEKQKNVMLSLNQLGLILLESAGVEMLPYYQYLLQLGKDILTMQSIVKYTKVLLA